MVPDDDDDDDIVTQARPAEVLVPMISLWTRSPDPMPVERIESASHHRLVERPPIA
jgi:hypothetical protein